MSSGEANKNLSLRWQLWFVQSDCSFNVSFSVDGAFMELHCDDVSDALDGGEKFTLARSLFCVINFSLHKHSLEKNHKKLFALRSAD